MEIPLLVNSHKFILNFFSEGSQNLFDHRVRSEFLLEVQRFVFDLILALNQVIGAQLVILIIRLRVFDYIKVKHAEFWTNKELCVYTVNALLNQEHLVLFLNLKLKLGLLLLILGRVTLVTLNWLILV